MTLAEDRAELARSQRAAREERAVFFFLKAHPESNYAAAIDLLRQHHHGEELTPETLEESANFLVARGELQPISQAQIAEAEEKERNTLLGHIRDRLTKSGLPQYAVEAEIKNRFQFMSVDELKQKIADQDLAKQLRSKTTAELREQVRAQSPALSPSVLPAEYTREKLVQLVKADLPAFRALVKRYGSSQVDSRLGVVASTKPGVSWTR
jgi:hypothetical protein